MNRLTPVKEIIIELFLPSCIHNHSGLKHKNKQFKQNANYRRNKN